jgi:aryl-alcohol dehydrogenase-like predicted oxidoreductase
VNDYSEDATLRSIEDSLKRSKTEHVEIAWVHDVAQDFYGDPSGGGRCASERQPDLRLDGEAEAAPWKRSRRPPLSPIFPRL